MIFKNLMNGVALSSLMLRAPEDESAAAAKVALREKLAKGNLATENVAEIEPEAEEEVENEEETEEVEAEAEETDPPAEETAEQKTEREAQEKIAAKAKRKDDRMQRRIDTAVAEKKVADAEIARLKAQLEANPDTKLTAEEVESRAEAIAAKKVADRELADAQARFDEVCGKLQTEAKKIDKDFDAKITDVATDFGPIPRFMINALDELENGGEVLAFIANDDDVAEKLYSFQNRPARMTKELVEISNKLLDAKKKPKKQISKVPDPITPVNGSRVTSAALTEADAKNMDTYVAKRQKMMLEKRKAQGF
jgi:hypothetical protein